MALQTYKNMSRYIRMWRNLTIIHQNWEANIYHRHIHKRIFYKTVFKWNEQSQKCLFGNLLLL